MPVGAKATAYLTVEDQSGPGLAKFQANMRRAGDTVASLGGSFSRALAATGLAAAGIGASAGAFAVFAKNALDSVAALDDLSESTSLSVEFLDKLQQVATRGGHSFEAITNAAGKFSESVAKARGGNKELLELFDGLGVSAEELASQSIDQLFERVARAIGTARDSAIANAYATGLMGKSARELAPVFNDIIESGLGFSRVTAQMAADADRAQKAINASKLRLEELSLVLGGALADRMNGVSEALDRASRSGESFATTFGNVFRAIVSGSDVTQARDQFAEASNKIIELRGKLADLDKPAAPRTAGAQAIADRLRAQIEGQIKQAEAARDAAVTAINRLEAKNAPPKKDTELRAPGTPTAPKAAAGPRGVDPFDQRRQQLEQELQRTQQLTAVEELLQDLQTGRLAKVSAAQRDVLIGLAAQVDLAREDARVQKEAQDAAERSARASAAAIERENERLENAAQRWRDLIDPTEEYRRKIAEIAELVNRGKLTPEEGQTALEIEAAKVLTSMSQVQEATKETNDIARDLGLTFSSAFEDAVINGEKFSKVLRGIEQDLLRILTRKLVTEPLFAEFEKLIKGFGGAAGGGGGGGGFLSGLGSLIGGFFGFQHGGSFTVGGFGGPDSQLVAFRATPGERVTVNTPQQASGGAVNIVQNFSIVGPVDRRTQQQLAAEGGRGVSRALRRNG